MLDNIQPLEQIATECQEIQLLCEQEISEQGNVIVEYGMTLSAQLARTGKMLADAKYHQNKARRESILNELRKDIGLPASSFNELIKASTERETYLVDWCDRLNKACTHKLDWCRSVLSKIKAELNHGI